VCFSSLYLEFKVDQFVRHEMDEAEHDEASAADWAVAHHLIPANTKRCLEILVELRRQLVQVAGVLLVVFVPIVVLSAKYNVYSFPAGWVNTFSYVRGTVPAVIMLVVWNLALAFFRYVFFTFETEEESEENEGNKDVATSSEAGDRGTKTKTKPKGGGNGSHGLGEVRLSRAVSLFAAPPSLRDQGTKGEDVDKDRERIIKLPPHIFLAFDRTEADASSGTALRVVFKKDDLQALLKRNGAKELSFQALDGLPKDSSGLVRGWVSVSACVGTEAETDAEAGAGTEAEGDKDLYSRAFEMFGGLPEFFGVAELEKDAAGMNPRGVEDIEWAIHLFSGIFLGVFLWDCMGGELGWKAAAPVAIVMLVFPSSLSIAQETLHRLGRGWSAHSLKGAISAGLRVKPSPRKSASGKYAASTSASASAATLVIPFEAEEEEEEEERRR